VPLVLRLTYALGERRLRSWLGVGFDRDTELLAQIRDGQVRETPLGHYLYSLREPSPDMVADMLCLLAASGRALHPGQGHPAVARARAEASVDPEMSARLDELQWLERSIGKTGLLALRPVCRWKGRDRWQRYLLQEEIGS